MTQIAFPPENVSEAEFTTWVIDLAKLYGWTLRYHTRDSRGSAKGFPDWTMIHPGTDRLIFAELKGARTSVTEQQRIWIRALNRCGVRAFLWRPRDAPFAYEVLAHSRLPSLPGPMMQP